MRGVLIGQCGCKAVQFEVEDCFAHAFYCHCSQCRAASGSAFAVFAAIERSKLRIVSGADRLTVSERRARVDNFCSTCGSNVFSVVRDREFVEVPMGTLRDAPRIRPSFHRFVGSKAPWYEINDALPQYVEHAPIEAWASAQDAQSATQDQRAALSRQKSRSEYSRRMNRVLDYIDRHLDEALDLDALADIAHFSPFHFHRVFAAWMGETLGDHLRNHRLDRAADQLAAEPNASVLDIGLAVGFGSGEALARAFKLRFGCTPTVWRSESPKKRSMRIESARAKDAQKGARQDRNPSQSVRKQRQMSADDVMQHDRSDQFFAEINMKVKVVDFPDTRVAYLRNVGPMGETVGAFWSETVFPWMSANGLSEKPRYGIGLDNPMVTAPEDCRYDACVEVPEGFVAKKPAGVTVLPAGRYAVRSFRGTAATISDAWVEVIRDWLPSSAMQMDGRPMIEYYPGKSRVDAKTGVFECELWVPVKPL